MWLWFLWTPLAYRILISTTNLFGAERNRKAQRSFGLSQIGLSQLISSHTTLFILLVKHLGSQVKVHRTEKKNWSSNAERKLTVLARESRRGIYRSVFFVCVLRRGCNQRKCPSDFCLFLRACTIVRQQLSIWVHISKMRWHGHH
jgi:hypothetical protein